MFGIKKRKVKKKISKESKKKKGFVRGKRNIKKRKQKISSLKMGTGGMLREALVDINREILELNRQKKAIGFEIRNIDKSLSNSRETEKSLQQKIAKLIEREASFKSIKEQIVQKQEKLTDKLSKVQKIKFELGEV
ncbi:MAG: hypothetical protein WC584_01265 [Candidatus Pacearchaeota archaeon]